MCNLNSSYRGRARWTLSDASSPTTVPADTRPSRRVLLLTAAVALANLLVFVVIAEDLFDGGGLISRDHAVLRWFVDHRTHGLIQAARVVSDVGSFVPLAIVAVLIGIWLWRRGWRLFVAAIPLVSVALGSIASTVAKASFNRDRPPVRFRAATVTLAAFPSGHATDAAAFFAAASLTLAITVVRRPIERVALVGAGLVLTVLVGVSRLVLAVHWLSDVVAGWALGTAVAVTVLVVLWCVATRRDEEPRSS